MLISDLGTLHDVYIDALNVLGCTSFFMILQFALNVLL